MDEGGEWAPEALGLMERTLTASPHLEKYLESSPLVNKKRGPDYPGWEPGDVIWYADLGRTYTFWSEVNLARWVDQGYLDSQRQKLPRVLYNRLHRNKWPVGESGFVTQAQIEACEALYLELVN